MLLEKEDEEQIRRELLLIWILFEILLNFGKYLLMNFDMLLISEFCVVKVKRLVTNILSFEKQNFQ
jgi:hypothetical protein